MSQVKKHVTRNESIGNSSELDGVKLEIHSGVFKAYVSLFGLMLLAFLIAFAGRSEAIFVIVISCLYGLMYFLLPFVLLKQKPEEKTTKSGLKEFLRGKVSTNTGVISGFDAAVQVLLIPTVLASTIAIVSLIIAFSR